MLKELLTEDVIRIYDKAENWKQAVELSCAALIDKGAIEPCYIDAIFRSHEEIGPYYVVGPKIAMPHARPEDGVNKMSFALTVIREGVNFNSPDNDPVKLLLTLAATDKDSHVDAIAKLAELFMNEAHVDAICRARNIAEIIEIIEQY